MVSQRSVPQLTQASSQKKQQSISSFFTSKPATTPKVTNPDTSDGRSPVENVAPLEQKGNRQSDSLFVNDDEGTSNELRRRSRTPKRGLEDDGGNSPSTTKRVKGDTNGTEYDSVSRDSDDALDPAGHRKSHGAVSTNSLSTKKAKVTGRTSKYLFSSSPQVEEEGEDEESDEQVRKQKERLHQKFVKRLGKPDSIAEIKRRNHFISEETQDDEEAAEEEEAEEEPEPPTTKKKGRKGPPAKKSRDKLTPLEKQVIDIKRKHPDTLLVVEVGYKFRFFGEDARTAAKELSIVCIPGKFRFDEHPSEAHIDRFASASIPVHRLHVHVKRLVSAGHKVGVVRQLETAALKAAGENRNKAFERGLTNLYTKGTYIDDQEGLDAAVAAPEDGAPATGHLLCLTETYPKGWGSDERVQIGLVAVQPATGDIIYDDFGDGWMRSELETRLLHIAPCEFLIVGDVSKATEKLVRHLSGSKTNVFGDKARVERVSKPKTSTLR